MEIRNQGCLCNSATVIIEGRKCKSVTVEFLSLEEKKITGFDIF